MTMKINDYEFESQLGRGSFGYKFNQFCEILKLEKSYNSESVKIVRSQILESVYLIRRKRDGKPFVVKEQALDGKNTLSFKIIMGEIQCFQKTRHPNVVAYHGAWLENEHSYILMEYATRCTLKDLLDARNTPLTENDALYLFAQVVLGVHHIHFNGILHRDLKPENIMLTGSRGDIVKIGDFGVSKNLQGFNARKIACRAGSFYYMSPEMLAGQAYHFKSDVWSMGVLLYEMLTKRRPFPATTFEEIVRKALKEKPKSLPTGLSTEVVGLISKMLRKQAVQRPTTEQLILCPYLVAFVSRVHLNLGLTLNTADNENFRAELLLRFFKPTPTHV